MTGTGVLVLAGPPCAGKSSVGKVLAAGSSRSRSVYLEVDSLFSLLFPESDRNRNDRMLGYDAAHVLARMLFERGLTPILECTYSRLEQRASLVTAMADIPEAPLWVAEFRVSPDEAVQRFQRRHQATDLDEHLVRERAETFPYSDHALQVLSSTTTSDDLARQIAAWLANQPESIRPDLWAQVGKGWD